jgi:hypothetical protein
LREIFYWIRHSPPSAAVSADGDNTTIIGAMPVALMATVCWFMGRKKAKVIMVNA